MSRNEFDDSKISMVHMLNQSRRHDEAAKLLTEIIGEDPENAYAHYLMALTLCEMEGEGKKTEALRACDSAISYEADDPYYYSLRADLLNDLKRTNEAHEAADEAIRLNPDLDVGYIAKAKCYFQQSRWKAAEEQLRAALTIDPDDTRAGNLLAIALRMQSKMTDTDDTIDRLLSENPEDSFSHFNAGWAALQNKDHRKAETHFTECLRLNPEFDQARQGLLESFKARSAFYRVYLRYCFFMQRFTQKAGFALMIGLLVLVNVASKFLPQPLATVLIGAYLIFVLWIWLADGIGHFLVSLDRRARLALRRRELIEGYTVGFGFILGVILFFTGLAIDQSHLFLGGAFLALAAVPASLTFTNESKYGRLVFGTIMAFCYFGATVTIGSLFLGTETLKFAASLLYPAILTNIACTWIANIPSLREAKET